MAFISGRTSFIFGIEEITVYCYSDMRFIHFAVFYFAWCVNFQCYKKVQWFCFFLKIQKYFVSTNYLIV